MATEDRWEKVKDDDGQVYWWNTRTNESRWTEPPSGTSSQPPVANPVVKATSSIVPPPPPKRTGTSAEKSGGGGGDKSPTASTGGGRLGHLVSAGQNLVKSNSMRFKGMMNPSTANNSNKPSNEQAAPNLNTSQNSISSAANGNGGEVPTTWEVRRKKSIHMAYQAVQEVKTKLTSNGTDPASIDGHLRQQAKEKNQDVNTVIRNVEISKPFDVEKKLQVKFDEDSMRFSGIPESWADEAHRQFGVPIQTCPRTEVAGYSDRIPIVLVKLKTRFIELGGLEAEGVFRLAPDGQDVADAKLSINTGHALKSLEKTKDPHVVANLIKQFFRELKPKILNPLRKEEITEMAAMTDLKKIGERLLLDLPDPQKSAFFWLLDLLAEVAFRQDVNRMTPTNLAIVISPNLFDAGPDMDPFEELVLSQKVAAFTSICLKWRMDYLKAGQ